MNIDFKLGFYVRYKEPTGPYIPYGFIIERSKKGYKVRWSGYYDGIFTTNSLEDLVLMIPPSRLTKLILL